MTHVGIDLGKRQSHACIRGQNAEIRHVRIATTREALTKLLGGKPGKLLMEAGANSGWVARHLESLGWEVFVGDPNYAPMYSDRRRTVKNDRRDAEALLMACEKGNYRPAHRLSDPARAVRELAQARKTVVRMRSRVVVQVRAQLHARGLPPIPGGARTFEKRWRKTTFPAELAAEMAVMRPLMDVAAAIDEAIDGYDARLEVLADKEPDAQRLMTTPAIGHVTAATWLGTLDTPERFESGEKLASYIGLVPRLWQSSDSHRQGGITKKGPCELRSLLIEAAWSIFNNKAAGAEELRAWAKKIAARRGNNVAVVALARRLTCIMLAIWRDKTTFDASKLGRRPEGASS